MIGYAPSTGQRDSYDTTKPPKKSRGKDTDKQRRIKKPTYNYQKEIDAKNKIQYTIDNTIPIFTLTHNFHS